MKTIAQRLADFTSSLTLEDIPQEVTEAAKLHVLDLIGCGVAGHAMGAAAGAREAMLEGGLTGPSTAIGSPHGQSSFDAAFSNGVTCHALDFDDTHTGAIAHVSTVVVPAALAIGEEQGSSGADVLAAIIGGSEVVLRLGLAAGPRFHNVGFHPSAVVGVFGATAAAARIRGMDAAQTAQALGIAGSLSAGVLEHLADGSSAKRLHPGFAARSGILAARLAAYGETGPSTIIEGRFGLYSTFLRETDLPIEEEMADLGERWETPNVAFKPYPACHFVHAAVDATSRLRERESIAAADVERATAIVPADVVPIVGEPLAEKQTPRSEYDAKFSLSYGVATMLVHGDMGVARFSSEAIADPEVLDLSGRVDFEIRDFPTFGSALPGGVKIVLKDGREFEETLDYQRGGPDNPMTAAEVRAKFDDNTAQGLGGEEMDSLAEAILALENQPDLKWMKVLMGVHPAGQAG